MRISREPNQHIMIAVREIPNVNSPEATFSIRPEAGGTGEEGILK